MVTEGALTNILDVCSSAETIDGKIIGIASIQDQIQKHFAEFSYKGFRTLGIAYKSLPSESVITISDEKDMTFLGFLTPFRPAKGKYK